MADRRSEVVGELKPGWAGIESLEARTLLSTTYYVSPKGNDANTGTDPSQAWQHIQQAFNAALPGSTVDVAAGHYREKLTLNVSGNASDGFITFQAVGKVVVDGNNIAGDNLIYINGKNYVKIVGFQLCNNVRVNNGSGIRITGADDNIQILDNVIHNITGVDAMGITAYGSDPTAGISNLVVDGNQIYRCQPSFSEALTLNGNVHDFSVTNNYIHDVNNIGIDFIGGEGISPDPATDVARNGRCAGNRVTRAHFKGAGHEAAGIFVDGGQNIVVERNVTWADDIGIGVGCVNPNFVTTGVSVRDNVVYGNFHAGLSVGASDSAMGRVNNCTFTNNTLCQNNTRHVSSEIRLQYGTGNVIENNLVTGPRNDTMVDLENGPSGNTSEFNLFYCAGGESHALFRAYAQTFQGLSAFWTSTALDGNSIFANPLLAKPASNPRIARNSPAVNAGDPAFAPGAGETDFFGNLRLLSGRVDVGAVEIG